VGCDVGEGSEVAVIKEDNATIGIVVDCDIGEGVATAGVDEDAIIKPGNIGAVPQCIVIGRKHKKTVTISCAFTYRIPSAIKNNIILSIEVYAITYLIINRCV
jgi:hypothetical protein